MTTTLYQLVENLIKVEKPDAKYYFDYVPENPPLPYYRIVLISSVDQGGHKDDTVLKQVGSETYKTRPIAINKARVQIDFYSTSHTEAYSNTAFGLLQENVQDQQLGGYIHNISAKQGETNTKEKGDVQIHSQMLEFFIDSYKI